MYATRNVKLQVRDIHMQFGDKIALNHASFDVYEGEFLSILGPSGCGKTTALRILVGLQEPVSGTIYKDGIDITSEHPSKRGMGIVFQNYALFENMTVFENVEYALRIKKENRSAEARKEIRKKVIALLEQLELSDHLDKKPAQVSGGQQQRVAIARTLAVNPDIILFDEPMSALDVATRLSLRKELKRIQNDFGTTMIYITHDQEEAFAMSDRIMVMREGNVIQIGTPEEIIRNPADEYVRDFVLRNLELKVNSLSKFIKVSNGT
ncbi:MAG: ABC transporter ATP-binding protein [Oscillospiraceae bacterium]|nr:ABC transporter ATP-binding protein [Oscillospiraceae bacterium]